ncbi:hypothetical protein E2F50_12135 [Rhizobium deserti]|uniref:Uncharacterized protein n=1 Tax=Rhizobium deserti TaxID=2547961 RepID=A0A4R5UGH3_9HYPH|nr:hypothetical protein [Rhizobium deserti]TDK35015.1 hypothetical protein E2F50_12135 [Rhizobium deserti]
MKEWKLQPGQDIGMPVSAKSVTFDYDPEGYIVRCAHCDESLLVGYRPDPEVLINNIKCDTCGRFSRFDETPSQRP